MTMSKVISLRLQDDQVTRLQRTARALGRTLSEAASLLIEEGLRQREFAFVEFRDSPVGRQAYLQGTRLAVWHVVMIARSYGGDVDRTAEHLGIPARQVAAALQYAAVYPSEIESAIEDNEAAAERLPHLIPNLRIMRV